MYAITHLHENVCNILAEIPEGEWPLGNSRPRRDGNIGADFRQNAYGLAEDSTQACEDQRKIS
jgi:hypothetical protein